MMRLSIVLLVAGLVTPAHADDRAVTRNEAMVMPAKVPAAVAEVLGAGFYLAGRSVHSTNQVDEDFYIARLDRDGLHEILREQVAGGAPRGGLGMVWANPTTLITSDYGLPDDGGTFSIITVTGLSAKLAAPVSLRREDWKLANGEALESSGVPTPLVTRSGEVWFAMCVKKRGGECRRERYLRVFGGERTTSDRKPRKLVFGRVSSVFSHEDPLVSLPDLAPPAGSSVTLKKVTGRHRSGGFVCKSPTDRVTHAPHEPGFATRPERVRWLVAKPPIFAVSGHATNQVDQIEPYVEYYRACESDSMGSFLAMRPRIWAENVTVDHADKKMFHHEWRISVDDIVIGNVAGDSNELAIAPP